MANTYTSLHYHIVFSTKNCKPWMEPAIEQRVWAYLGGIVKQTSFQASLRDATIVRGTGSVG